MKLPDGSTLMHAGEPYDPQKAHDYYMRTRKLHPRGKGGGTYTIKAKDGHSYKLSAVQLEEQKNYAQARVEHLKKNLSDLRVLLQDKLQKAKEAQAKKSEPPTLAEKAKAAREAEKYRQTHKSELQAKARKARQTAANQSSSSGSNSGSSSPKTDTVDSLKKEIATTKANLKTAIAKQRELVMAKKNG